MIGTIVVNTIICSDPYFFAFYRIKYVFFKTIFF